MGKKYIARGLPKRTRTQNYHRKGLWAMKQRGPVPGVQKKRRGPGRPKVVTIKPFGKDGKETRTVVRPREPRVYHPDPIKHKAHYRKTRGNPPKVRSSLTPGTVCIVLSGRCRGRRVILLKVLESGLLLVTGPYKANGVPIRRINPAYVIATSTKINISEVKLPKKLNDDFFKKPKGRKSKKGSASDFLKKKVKTEPTESKEPKEPKEKEPKGEKSEERKSKKARKEKSEKSEKPEKEDTTKEKKRKSKKPKGAIRKNKITHKRQMYQKKIDEQIIPIIKKEPYLYKYLKSLFTLKQGQYPHDIKF
jgi:large subunit ribosomal protein L6e